MGRELAKTYDPSDMEGRLYEKWEKSGYFHAVPDRSKKPFTIVMPPPNITGQLHMGHALDNTMQDILIRFKRMQGYNALWQPGTDHASIATEVRVMSELKKEGIDKHDLGREKFLDRVWQWREEYGGRITRQLRKMGSSCDWERERFTMDEGCNRAVTEVFVNLYNKGLIYKGARIINWCPVCNTSISDAEVEYVTQPSHLWHIKYPVDDGGKPSKTEFLTFATTRPETMLGDTAVAVHPDDERYTHLHGKSVWLPIVDKLIPVVEDTYVDMEFGTGVVKITPGHDPNDFEVGKRHDLPIVNVMNDDGTINENGGKYEGMTDLEARAAIVEELKELGLLVKIEDYDHNVGTHDRCGTTIQPLVKQQWFVKMDDLIKPARDAVATGDIKLVPPRMDRTYYNWTDNIRDWCISRQLWWGHRIPAYYCADCGEMTVSKEPVCKCGKCGSTNVVQDEDTLDTWFSSALWPFSTLGWPDKTEELDYFYPTDVLVTGYDIIFFWVIRMIFSGYEHMGKKPFSTVLFHGLVRDGLGRKMSKSLGNGIDPLEVIEKYGADALRFTLVTGNAPGNDMRFTDERVEASRNFANKVWNASRFIMMNMEGKTITKPAEDELWAADRWVLSKLNKVVREVTDNMEKFELGIAVSKVYDFIYDVLCDWYIEMVKPRLYNTDDAASANAALHTLKTVLIDSLKLLHPYMPFITEEIYCTLTESDADREADSIMISAWPKYDSAREYEEDEAEIELIKEAVRGIRNVRSEMNVAPSKKASVFIVTTNDKVKAAFTKGKVFFESLAGAESSVVVPDRTGIDDDAVSVMIADAAIYIPFAELVDISAEIDRLTKEKQRLAGEIKRCEGMLSNEKFVSKAPEAKINEEKEKLEKYTQLSAQVEERLATLTKTDGK
ncbi:MAG: valine--tRNA ligase [Lachnospiraceae bacterium]|nr:valine--tRNA ligase [Lachnospiraceae bacterium]